MATDKRLDQVSQLTDFDYALIVKGDQVAKASKQQLAELVGNLLYGATDASSLASVVAGQNFTILSATVTNNLRTAPSGVWFIYEPSKFSDNPYNSGFDHTSMLISVNNASYKCHVLIDVESVSTNNQGIWVSYQSQIWKKIL